MNRATRRAAVRHKPRQAPQYLNSTMGGPVNCNDSELSIYLQALAEGYLPTFYSDTSQSAQSKSMSIASKSFRRGKKTVVFHGFPSLKMSRHSTASHGAELLTSWLEGFRAKTSALPETARGLTENAVGCGTTWPASLAKFDPDTSLWKTAQRSLLEDWAEFSETWPRWGLMRAGECWERQTLVPRTSESASGLWQTPVADDAVNRAAGQWNSRGEPKLSAQVLWPTPLANSHTGAGHGPNKTGAPNLQTMVAMWPTPTRDSATERTGRYAQGGLPLTAAVYHWPTPTVCGNYNRKGASATSGDGLATAVATSLTMSDLVSTDAQTAKARMYPTATATAYKGWSPNHNRAATDDRLNYTIEREACSHGQQTPQTLLNPDWVEVLMGWPNEMTSLNPISSVKMCFWLMGFCDDEKTGRTQVLRVLREGNAAKEIRAAIGRPVCISEAAFLLHELCEYANRPYEARIFMACAETLEGEMRSVRLHEGITGAPHRPGQDAQRPEKHTDSMQALSRLLAHHGQEAWENGSWEDGIPRVVDGMAHRSHRLKAIGNGQVPICAAVAFALLGGAKEFHKQEWQQQHSIY